MMGNYDGMGGGFGFGGGFMILWWVILIAIIVVAARWLITYYGAGRRSVESKALEILKERYARGEIDEAEYQKRKHDLTQ